MSEQSRGEAGRGKDELLAAYDRLVESERTKAATPPPSYSPRRTGPWQWVVLAAMWGFLAYIWVGRPGWLFQPALGGPAVDAEASLRFAMYLERQRVTEYHANHGRLPLTLEEAGDMEEGIGYERVSDSTFILRGQDGTFRVEYQSLDPIGTLLGDTFKRLGIPGDP